MTAVKRALYIEQGATFTLGFNWYRESLTVPGTAGDPYDLTGCIVRMQIRKTQQGDMLVDATTVNGKITLDPLLGRIDVKLADIDTDLLTSKTSIYDLEVEFLSGDVFRLLEGSVTVSPNVTQKITDPVVV